LLVADGSAPAVVASRQRGAEAHEAEARGADAAVQESVPESLDVAPWRVTTNVSERQLSGDEATGVVDEVSEPRCAGVELASIDPRVDRAGGDDRIGAEPTAAASSCQASWPSVSPPSWPSVSPPS
jgi:hypothetical protein